MRCVIAGGRDIEDMSALIAALDACPWSHEIREVVSGGARGADALGERLAHRRRWHVTIFRADWEGEGKAAGPLRNRRMATYAARCPAGGGLVALWDGKSKGTKNMIAEAKRAGLRVFVWRVDLGRAE